MQVYANIATEPVRIVLRSTNKGYWQAKVCESTRGQDDSPTFYTLRIMKDVDPCLSKGNFVKVTGKLKANYYLSREGKPTEPLLFIAFEDSKISKPAAAQDGEKSGAIASTKEQVKEKAPASQHVRPLERLAEKALAPAQKTQLATEQANESDWTALYS